MDMDVYIYFIYFFALRGQMMELVFQQKMPISVSEKGFADLLEFSSTFHLRSTNIYN